MHLKYIAVGVGSFSLLPLAQAAGYQFNTLLDSSDIAGLVSVDQVVLGNSTQVAVIANGDDTVVAYKPGVGLNTNTVIVGTQYVTDVFGTSNNAFTSFSNLSLSPSGQIVFAATPGASGIGNGVYAYNINTATARRILSDGDNLASASFSYTPGNQTQYGLQASSTGNVVFGGQVSGSTNVVVHGSAVGPSYTNTKIADDSENIKEFNNLGNYIYGTKKVPVGSTGTVMLARIGVVDTVVRVDPMNAITPLFAAGTTVGGLNGPTGTPKQLIGATSDSQLFTASLFGTGILTGVNDFGVLYHSSTGTSVLASRGTSQSITPYAIGTSTETGKAAFTIVGGNGPDTLYYADGASVHTIATVGVPDTNTGLILTSICLSGSGAPAVNDNGVVVFDGTVLDTNSNAHNAILAWKDGALSLVAREGGTLDLNNNPNPVPITQLNGLMNNIAGINQDTSVFKDGLSEDNHLAFFVTAGGENQVVITSIPEPSGLAGIGALAYILMPRRRKTA